MTIRREWWKELLAPTDPAILEAGAGGERLIARMRVVFWAAIWLIPIATILAMREPPPEVWIALVASTAALVVSVMVVFAVPRFHRTMVVPFASAAFDVSLVTMTLAAVALAGRPLVAVNSLVIWPVYLLAIVATAFRLDFRVAAFAGALSVAEYLALAFWISGRWDVAAGSTDYGSLSWPTQFGRLLLVLGTTALTAGIIHQTRRFAYVSGNDRLTGLGNRALFDERLKIEIARAERAGTSVTLAFLDIDRFKRFNDRWGHHAGDEALVLLADVIRSQLRASDSAYRWGGEELIVLLPETDAASALPVLERIRGVLTEVPLPGIPEDERVTVSAGVSEFPREARSAEELLARADHRLLVAKSAGRNRVVGADSPEPVRRAS